VGIQAAPAFQAVSEVAAGGVKGTVCSDAKRDLKSREGTQRKSCLPLNAQVQNKVITINRQHHERENNHGKCNNQSERIHTFND